MYISYHVVLAERGGRLVALLALVKVGYLYLYL